MARSMDPELYRMTIIGDIDCFIRALEDGENCLVTQVSPQGNIVLHIAASLGHDRLIEFILHNNHDLVKVKNSKGDLAFHLSASAAGHLSTIKLLASSLRRNEFMDLLKEHNKDMNTALLAALKKHHEEVAFFLIDADPDVSLYLNSEGKSPLYMAAEAGWADLVKLMMGNKLVAIGSDYVNDRINGKSLVHAAITGKSIEVLDIVLTKNSILIHSIDEEGRSPLSHAASIGYYNGVSYLLDKFIQGTYQRNQNGFFPIHMAASRGHVEIIQEFLRCCPDSSELLNKHGQNIVHVAAKNGKDNVIKYVLKTPELEKFINEKDEKGNKPLHLPTMHWRPKIVNLLTWDERVWLELVNDAGLTALDVAEKHIGTALPFRKGMARNLGFLVLTLSVIFVCEAMIFHPNSESHRFAELELFTSLHGSFGSLEEASEALRTFEILGIGKDLNVREMRSIANLASRDHKDNISGELKVIGCIAECTCGGENA